MATIKDAAKAVEAKAGEAAKETAKKTTAAAKKTTAAAKETAAKAGEVAKETATKAGEAAKETAKKTTAAAKKTTAAAKTTAKKAVTKAAAKVSSVKATTIVQYQNNEVDLEKVEERVKAQFMSEGHKADDIKKVNIYVKPEEYSAYYVINDKFSGRVSLF